MSKIKGLKFVVRNYRKVSRELYKVHGVHYTPSECKKIEEGLKVPSRQQFVENCNYFTIDWKKLAEKLSEIDGEIVYCGSYVKGVYLGNVASDKVRKLINQVLKSDLNKLKRRGEVLCLEV